ncbi:hypothetical protein PTTG_01688 [Puccinia triticina 1-1 BBBD Race 1]|uniref:Uncharacterized protein n=1 Tax=Puccinia triticina (isolate 1-1 / race 1 (BBBD)) TaxID=630390 RepID=A0A180GFP0_PUCT1|nr:hypothetical protein PTTG_01688 [Puccinia triticina 1-1 BBBD Race 1]
MEEGVEGGPGSVGAEGLEGIRGAAQEGEEVAGREAVEEAEQAGDRRGQAAVGVDGVGLLRRRGVGEQGGGEGQEELGQVGGDGCCSAGEDEEESVDVSDVPVSVPVIVSVLMRLLMSAGRMLVVLLAEGGGGEAGSDGGEELGGVCPGAAEEGGVGLGVGVAAGEELVHAERRPAGPWVCRDGLGRAGGSQAGEGEPEVLGISGRSGSQRKTTDYVIAGEFSGLGLRMTSLILNSGYLTDRFLRVECASKRNLKMI